MFNYFSRRSHSWVHCDDPVKKSFLKVAFNKEGNNNEKFKKMLCLAGLI